MVNPEDRKKRGKWLGVRERGQAVVEFAVVATVFIMFIFGIIDCARLFESWTAVQHAAREGARLGVTGQGSCTVNNIAYSTSRSDCVVKTVQNSTTGILGGNVGGTAVQVRCRSFTYASGYASGTGYALPCTDASLGGPCDAIEVEVTYTQKFMTFYLSALKPSGVPLVGRQRMINEPFGACG